MNRPTRVAVLGCGYWGINYVRVFTELADAQVAVVCDERENRLDEVRRRFPGVAVTTDSDEALRDPSVEAAVIATEAKTHRKLAGEALLAGKHVLVEKPLALTVQHADELTALADRCRRLLLVGHTFLYNPGIRKVKECIDSSYLGRPYYVYARRTSLGPIRADVNAVWDLAPHDVAIFNYLLDSIPTWVSAVGARVLGNSREDVGFISLGYASGVMGHIHVSWADPNKVREVVVVGSDKRIVFNDLDLLERVRIYDKGVRSVPSEEPTTFGEFHLQLRDGDIFSPNVPVIEPLKAQCGHFVHCIRRGDTPLTNGHQGRDVVRVMEAIERSMATNGAPVAIERGEETSLEAELVGALP